MSRRLVFPLFVSPLFDIASQPAVRPLRRVTRRRGSAIVLCCLAMAVLSLASIAIVRSHARLNVRRSTTISQTHGRMLADALLHREIAWRRNPGNTTSAPTRTLLRDLPRYPSASVSIDQVSLVDNTIDLSVRLYPAAPAAKRARIDLD